MALTAADAQAEDTRRAAGDGAKPVATEADATTETAEEQGGGATEDANNDLEDGEVDAAAAAPPLPGEPTPDGPPLPNEPAPDDGWDCQFDSGTQAWFFYNRFTGKTQWDNPRVPTTTTTTTTSSTAAAAPGAPPPLPQPPTHEEPAAGGYNPAIHGDYDPNAWYAKGSGGGAEDDPEAELRRGAAPDAQQVADMYAATVSFNRHSGGFQSEAMGPGRHTDEAKAARQMNAYFDSEAAEAAHDGRSLRAERQGKKPSKAEVKAFKEKRRARKEEKRRAWLRD